MNAELFKEIQQAYADVGGNYELCVEKARAIVQRYRDEAPEGLDAQAVFVVDDIFYIIAIVAAIAAASVSAYGAHQAAKSQEDVADYNAKVARNNAIAAKNSASYDADRLRDRNKRLRATQATSYLKAGVTLEGSAQDVMYDSALEGEMDALSVVYKGQLEINSQGAGADIYKMQGGAARQTGQYAVASSVLSGVGSAGSAYGSYQNASYRRDNPQFKSTG